MVRALYKADDVCLNCKRAFKSGVQIDFNGMYINMPKLCCNCARDLFLDLSTHLTPLRRRYQMDKYIENK